MHPHRSVRSEIVYRRVWKVSHDLPDENQVALFDQERSELLMINAVGAEIWDLLDGRRSLGDIVQELRALSPDAPEPEEMLVQVEQFLQMLLSRGAIELVPEPDASTP